MIFEIRFTSKAEETFEELVIQLRQRWGDKFVKKFEDKVEKTLHIISENPYIYPVTEDVTGSRRCILHKNCSLIYQVKDGVVRIICFWDNRQNPLFS